MSHHDQIVRLAAFDWLRRQVDLHGDVLPRDLLSRGFEFEGERVPLVSPQGIFKPRILDLPLTITTTPEGPYDDSFGNDGLLRYRYRGTDPGHPDNAGLREALMQTTPLIYLHGVVRGKYLAIWPDYIVEIRDDILHEIDGPMLQHGLQEMHGHPLTLPRRHEHRPDRELLELRYERFRSA